MQKIVLASYFETLFPLVVVVVVIIIVKGGGGSCCVNTSNFYTYKALPGQKSGFFSSAAKILSSVTMG